MDAAAWDLRYDRAELVWTAEPNRFLVEEAAGLAPGRALDLACGEGRNAVWLAQRGWRVTGVDFSSVGIRKAHELAARQGVEVEWAVADLTAYVPERSAFDLVIMLYLHLPPEQRQAVLRSAASALGPNGTLLVVGHDTTNLTQGVGGPQDAGVLFTPDDVVADLGRSGVDLEVERADRVRRPVATEEGERAAIDALVRCRRGSTP